MSVTPDDHDAEAEQIDLEVEVSAPRPGGWCDTCALPSMVEFDLLWLHPDGPKVLGASSSASGTGSTKPHHQPPLEG